MAPLPPIPSETDILFARHAVALAKSQRLIASWLPPLPHPHQHPTEKEQQQEEPDLDEDSALFTPHPERLGLGAALPSSNGDGDGNSHDLRKREEVAKNEKLKIQLLGRDWAMKMKMARGKGKYGAGTLTSTSSDTVATISTKAKTKHPPAGTKRAGYNNSGSEDDEAGRSSLGKSKNAALLKRGIEGFEIDDDVRDEGDGGFKRDKGAMCEKDMRSNPGAKKRASGYLDEVLADRALRKRRKKGRREEGAVGS